jgi:hypothetical protein
MNDINIINQRYLDLKEKIITGGIQVDDNFIINSNLAVLKGYITILDDTPFLNDITDGALYVKGGMSGNGDLYINYHIMGKNDEMEIECRSGNCETNNIQIGDSGIFNDLETGSLYCGDVNIYDNMDVKNLVTEDLDWSYTNKVYIENWKTNQGSIIVGEGNSDRVIAEELMVEELKGSGNIMDLMGKDIDGLNNLKVNGKRELNNFISDIYLKFNKIYAEINLYRPILLILSFELGDNGELIENVINTSLECKNIYVDGDIVTKKVNMNTFDINVKRPMPFSIDQTLGLTILNSFINLQGYENKYSIYFENNIEFQNPTYNFKNLTIFYDDYLPDLVGYKPRNGFYQLVGGYRSYIGQVYSVIYLVDFFNINSSQINISVYYDQGGINNFVSGFVYNIYKFSVNYLI